MSLTVEYLVEKLGGYTLNNKARVTIDGRTITIGRMGPAGYELTPEGAELANLEARTIDIVPVAETASPKARASRKSGLGLVDFRQDVGSAPATENSAE
ncbi:MAG: hypothetical protein KAX65_05500 [Caldilineaceae bacterium]|jgi:hypothetical protein|nr:hypothetical protein [Caldilineaceae bacterium]